MLGVGAKLALAFALLGVFIHVLNKVKSFRFPAVEYLLKNFDVGTLGVLGICFASAAASRACWACRRRWARSWAGWRWAIPPCGAAR